MKHLKKFNENVAEKYLQMHEILKDVFAELIDDTTIQVEFGYESDDTEILVTIKPWTKTQTVAQLREQLKTGSEMTTEQMIERYSKYLELVKDIEVCYKRAVDELNIKGKLMVAVDNRIYMAFKIPGAQKTEYPF